MKSGDKLKVKLMHGEVVDAIYVRKDDWCEDVDHHILAAVSPLPDCVTTDPMDKFLLAIVGRNPQYRWECSIVEPAAVQS